MNKSNIILDLMRDLYQTAKNNGVWLDSEPLYKSIRDNIDNDAYCNSDLDFATLCNTIGYLQAKIEYNNK